MDLEYFVSKIGGFLNASASDKIKLIVFYLTEVRGTEVATRSEVEAALNQIDEYVPSTTLSSHLSGGLSSSPRRYVRRGAGYRLERRCRDKLEKKYNLTAALREQPAQPSAANPHLAELETLLVDESGQRFLDEALTCFRHKAYRATVIMGWLLAVDYLHQAIVDRHLIAFNDHLSADGDKRLSGLVITTVEDLSGIKESKLIELSYKAKIFSRDVRKIWDERLTLRNSVAHPSNIDIGPAKAAAFIEDVVQNMIKKIA